MPLDGASKPEAHDRVAADTLIAAPPPRYGIDDSMLLMWDREHFNPMRRATVVPLRACYVYDDRLTAYQAAYEALTRRAHPALDDWRQLIGAAVDALRAQRESFPGRAADDLRAAGIEVTRATYHGADAARASDPRRAVFIHPHPYLEAAYVNAEWAA